jgi:ankyrin repeat-rich membrane spanning protein
MSKKKKKPVVRISDDKVLEFIRAAEAGNVRLVRALLKAGMNVNAAYQGGTNGSSNAFISAVRSGRTAVVDLLLKHGANPSVRALTIQRLGTQFPIDALALAAEKGHLEIVQLLIKAGADVNKSMVYNLDSLNAAVVEGHLAVVRELLGAGYSVNSPGGQKALDAAIAAKKEKIALLLIATGVDVRSDTEGLLLNAAVKGLVKTVKAMLDAGANPKSKLFTGKSTLQSFKTLRRRKEDWEYWDGDNRNEKVADAIQQLLENAA